MIIIIIVIIMIIFIIIIMINDHDYHHFQINHDTKGPRAVPAPVCVWSNNSMIIFYLSSSHRCHIHHRHPPFSLYHNRPASVSTTCLWKSSSSLSNQSSSSSPLSKLPKARKRFQHLFVELQPGDALFFHSNLLHTSAQVIRSTLPWLGSKSYFERLFHRISKCSESQHTEAIFHDLRL